MKGRRQEDRRLALACWDYTWLPDCAAASSGVIERHLDEACERGFNALRLDPFPHLLGPAQAAADLRLQLTADPCRGIAAGRVRVPVEQACRRLVQGAHRRGLALWLTGFFVADDTARHAFVRQSRDYVDVWVRALERFREWGALDAVVAVDFRHHFVSSAQSHGMLSGLLRSVAGKSDRPGAAQDGLSAVPRALRALYPDIRFGVSVAASYPGPLRELNTAELDFLDLGLWSDASGTGGRRRAPTPTRVEALAEDLERRLIEQLDFTTGRRLQPVLGEGYLRLPPAARRLPDGWMDLSERLVTQARRFGVRAITPATLAEPRQAWLWRQKAWLKGINRRIRADRS